VTRRFRTVAILLPGERSGELPDEWPDEWPGESSCQVGESTVGVGMSAVGARIAIGRVDLSIAPADPNCH
jgi:hypothetical protein